MLLSRLPALVASCFVRLACALDRRSALRLPVLLCGLLFARGRRTCTAWFRAAGITVEFRRAYHVIGASGRRSADMAGCLLPTVDPLLAGDRLCLVFDDTPTKRPGPCVEGAGRHRNPTSGAVEGKFLRGHVWVCLAAVAHHPQRGTVALPLRGELYIRRQDIAQLAPDRQVPFRTKLEMAADLLRWVCLWRRCRYRDIWAFVDGGYSKRPFLGSARQQGVVVVGRLPKNAALWSVPDEKPAGRPGPQATYGKQRIVLHLRAGHQQGWQQVKCRQYGETVTKTVKTFEATWRPAAGKIRVVLVQEQDGWVAFFCTKASATIQEVLEAAADRNAIEQTNKDVKEVWGAGQQQVRNLHASIGCFNLNLWMYSQVEAWAWDRRNEDLVDRENSPWDYEPRRPSHADKRKALQREVLRAEIDHVLAGPPDKERFRALAERLLDMAT